MVFSNMSSIVLQLRNLSVGLGEEPCIEFIQENSIENSVQDGLPYIQIPNGLYVTLLCDSMILSL